MTLFLRVAIIDLREVILLMGGAKMGLNTREVNEYGQALCCVCRKKKEFNELENCIECGRMVCKDCCSYQRQFPFGYICRTCQRKRRES